MIRIDQIWITTEYMGMRSGTDKALARVVKVFGAAHPNYAYLLANRRVNCTIVKIHYLIGVWLAAWCLHQGPFVWPRADTELPLIFRYPSG